MICLRRAAWIERAVARVLADGYRTGDIYREGEGKKVGTTEMGERVRDAVLENIFGEVSQ